MDAGGVETLTSTELGSMKMCRWIGNLSCVDARADDKLRAGVTEQEWIGVALPEDPGGSADGESQFQSSMLLEPPAREHALSSVPDSARARCCRAVSTCCK